MQLNDTIENMFAQLRGVLTAITDEVYTTPVAAMSGSSIGEHTRHIIEFYLELQNGYENGTVNYDNRKRDHRIQTERRFAAEKLNAICNGLVAADKPLSLQCHFGEGSEDLVTTTTNYTRELVYNLEHTVHHMALIRVALSTLTSISLPTEFGVAAATLQFRKACVQ